MKEIPEFQTERLFLRGITLEDTSSYQKHFVDYEVVRYLADHVPWPYPENGIEEFLKEYILPNQAMSLWMWGIFLKEKPTEVIGAIELCRKGKPENRGFWLGRKFWGKGLMTEAVAPITDYAFTKLGFEKLIFANAVGNIGSRRVKEKSGAKLIGTEPAKFVDPKFTEHELWELTKEDWSKP